jgi:Arc/MetJ-type ribon-helix-helix transcriptional regulator
MTVNIPAEFKDLVEGKLQSGEYRSEDEIVKAAMYSSGKGKKIVR